jgi:hypothetical protein
VDELKSPGKPFDISKRAVWEAYQKVKANKGASGVDEVSIEEFEKDLKTICLRSGIGCLRVRISRPRCLRSISLNPMAAAPER